MLIYLQLRVTDERTTAITRLVRNQKRQTKTDISLYFSLIDDKPDNLGKFILSLSILPYINPKQGLLKNISEDYPTYLTYILIYVYNKVKG